MTRISLTSFLDTLFSAIALGDEAISQEAKNKAEIASLRSQ